VLLPSSVERRKLLTIVLMFVRQTPLGQHPTSSTRQERSALLKTCGHGEKDVVMDRRSRPATATGEPTPARHGGAEGGADDIGGGSSGRWSPPVSPRSAAMTIGLPAL